MNARVDATLWLNEESTSVSVKIARAGRHEIDLAVVLPDYAADANTPSTTITLSDVDAAALVGALSVLLAR